MKIAVLFAGALLLAQFHPANPPGGVTVNKPWLGNPPQASPVATNTPFAVNGSPVPGTAAAGFGLFMGPGGTPTWGATPVPAYPTPATPTPFALNGSPVPGTASPGSYLVSGPGGTPKWTATLATSSPGPTFAPSPTAIAGLPSCVPGFIGNRYQVTDQNCTLVWGATPVSTAGTGCQVPVYCGGAATGTPTPSWTID